MTSEMGDAATGLAERLIVATDWTEYRRSAGRPATEVGGLLTSLLNCSDPEGANLASDAIENAVAVQANLYSSAEPAVRVLAASLADPRPRWVKLSVLDLMFLILSGAPVADEVKSGNANLLERCIARVQESLWLIVRAAIADPTCMPAALDVLNLVDDDGTATRLLRGIA